MPEQIYQIAKKIGGYRPPYWLWRTIKVDPDKKLKPRSQYILDFKVENPRDYSNETVREILDRVGDRFNLSWFIIWPKMLAGFTLQSGDAPTLTPRDIAEKIMEYDRKEEGLGLKFVGARMYVPLIPWWGWLLIGGIGIGAIIGIAKAKRKK